MKGYHGRSLRVDLTAGKCSTEEQPEDLYRRYLGGRGFIVYTLLNELAAGVDPLGPENKLIFSLGPITGHPLVGSGRHSVGAKSPLTGGFGESEAGGYWGAELKKSGYDFVIIQGVSARPVYLWIDNGQAEIRDASTVWGMEVADTERAIREELGDARIRLATIGPAGENLVRFASIAHDVTHIAGRAGLGAVMGSKRLKAVAVSGKESPEVADGNAIKELTRWMGQNFKEKPGVWVCGTGSTMTAYEGTGNLPVRNFNGGVFPGVKNICPQSMFDKAYVEKMDGCFICPLKCKRRVRIDKPLKVNPEYGGPEYETLAALGSNCCIDDVEVLSKANELCNRYGMDTISTGVTISFAMECFEKEILTLEDADGLELTFGNGEAMLEIVDRIALRQGFGDVLAEGCKKAAERIGKGSAEYAMHVKGLEIPMHEPRYKQGMGLHYSVHPMGADHCSGIHDDLVIKNLAGWEGIDVAESIPSTEMSTKKARMLYQVGLWRQMGNTLGVCIFVPWSQNQIIQAMEAITGWPMSHWRLMKTVERSITLARIFNVREGLSDKDDILPHRFFSSALEGPLKDVAIDMDEFIEARKAYYQMLGWNESGVPTSGRLAELDIEWASQYLRG